MTKTKLGANQPCSCGSGRKYKRCCWPKQVKSNRSPAPPDREQGKAEVVQMTRNGRIPPGFRNRLEDARLDMRALYRTSDRLHLAQDLPKHVLSLGELDADFAEALCVLDKDLSSYDVPVMVRDTLASLDKMPFAIERALALLAPEQQQQVGHFLPIVRDQLPPEDAYLDIPGRDQSA